MCGENGDGCVYGVSWKVVVFSGLGRGNVSSFCV